MDCIFCKIANGEIPSSKVYEDDVVIALHDISPQAPVHILFIPKEHIENVDEINSKNSSVIAHIFECIPKVAKKHDLKNGYRVVTNCNEHGCQSVYHLHFHLLGGEKLSGVMC